MDRRSLEEVERIEERLGAVVARHRFGEEEFPVKVEFLVERAVVDDGTVYDARDRARALEDRY